MSNKLIKRMYVCACACDGVYASACVRVFVIRYMHVHFHARNNTT